MPVSLSASLPACGWPSSLHSGLEADAVVELVDDVEPLVPGAVLVDAVVAELTEAPVAEAEVSLLRDWLPVEALVLLLSDWSPVLVVVLLVSDWSPVDVVLSIDRLERPRRSTVGETVEVDPVIEEFTSALDPVTAELLLEAEPVIDEVESALAVVLVVVSSLVVLALFCASAGAAPSIAATASALI
jgi:hypothetical protein